MSATSTPPEARRGLSLPAKLVLFVLLPLLIIATIAGAAFAAVPLLSGRSVDLHFTADAGSSVRVEVPNARLDFVASEGDQVTVDVTGRWSGPEPDFQVETTGDETRVEGDCQFRWFAFCNLTVRVGLPPESDLTVTGRNGGITVDGVEGSVDVGTTNGRIELSELSGPVTATSTNGGVALSGGTSDRVVARTTNGAVQLEFSAPPTMVEARSTNGGITVRVPDDGEDYYIDAETTNGSIGGDVDSDRRADRTITARTTNGGITVERGR